MKLETARPSRGGESQGGYLGRKSRANNTSSPTYAIPRIMHTRYQASK